METMCTHVNLALHVNNANFHESIGYTICHPVQMHTARKKMTGKSMGVYDVYEIINVTSYFCCFFFENFESEISCNIFTKFYWIRQIIPIYLF